MEGQPKYVLQLSLQEMALRRVAVLLWNESSVMEFTPYGCFDIEIDTRWQEDVEQKVNLKVSELELPDSLKKQMMDVIGPIGLQIRMWKESFQADLQHWPSGIGGPFLTNLCWKSTGVIDYRKTAERVVRSDMLDLAERYKVACLYCLEEDTLRLWEELPEQTKENFCDGKNDLPFLYDQWPHILGGKLPNLDYLLRAARREGGSFNQHAFELAAANANRAAVEFFFQKLTDEERNDSLMRTAHAVVTNRLALTAEHFLLVKQSDVLCYLLSLMTPQQQMGVVRSQPILFWSCFLNWPWQDLFVENADLMWAEIDPSSYDELLASMSSKARNSNHCSPKVFQEFFLRSPPGFKKYFVTQSNRSSWIPAATFLCHFFQSDDAETIQVIFRNTAAPERARILLHIDVVYLFSMYIRKEKWNMVEVCLREAELSKEDKERLKDALIVLLRDTDMWDIELGDRMWERFFELLN